MNNTAHTDPQPWVSRINPQLRATEPDAFPERILTHGVDYSPRDLEIRILVTYKGETGYLSSETDINLRTRYGRRRRQAPGGDLPEPGASRARGGKNR